MVEAATRTKRFRNGRGLALAAIGVAGVVGLGVRPAHGDGIISDALSATSAGRGGANLGHADNSGVLLENPAGLTRFPARQVDVSSFTFAGDLHYSDPMNDTGGEFGFPENPAVLGQGSAVWNPSERPWAIGVGVVTPAGYGSNFELDAPAPFGGERTYRSFAASSAVVASGAMEVGDGLSLGATLGAGFTYTELESPFFLQSGQAAGTPVLVDLSSFGVAPTWSVGMQYQLSERTTVGLAYRGERRFRTEGEADTTVFGPGGRRSSEFDVELDFVLPRSLGGGVVHELNERHRVSLDLIWFDWSHAFDQLDYELKNPSNPAFTRVRDAIPLDWRDTLSIRVGHEWEATERDTFRVGYVYHRSPIPKKTVTTYIPATLEHVITLGYSRRFSTATLNAAYVYTFAPDQEVNDSALTGGDFDNSELEVEYHGLWLGVSLPF